MAKKVIDLSKFNPVKSWPQVKLAVDAVVLRLGYRGATTGTITYDPKFHEYADACKKHGIPIMIYFFPCSISTEEAHTEAKFIISAAAKLDLCGPIWIDSEVVYRDRSGRADNLSKERRTRYLNTIIEDLRAAGYDCGVYASTNWFKNNLNDAGLIDCRRWIADWSDRCSYSTFDYHMWQYTSKGRVPGIDGDVDISECYLHLDISGQTQAVKSGVTRQDIVDQMCSWEGWSECNSKYKTIIDIYNYYLPTAVKSGTLNYAVRYTDEWCATAASAAYIQAGAPELFPIECGCPRTITLAKKMGIWKENDGYIPKPADAILYDWQDSGSGDNQGIPDHIGIVIEVSKSAGNITVMEGNKDERVGRRILKIDSRYIRGFVSPKFAEDTKPTAKAETNTTKATTNTTKETTKKAGGYEISRAGAPSKKVLFTGILKNGKNIAARLQPDESAKQCSFSPVKGLTRISVCDYISTDKRWAYCCINGLYGYILASSIEEYVRIGGQKIDTVVQWVLSDDFGTRGTRKKCLEDLGYNYDDIQAAVTARINAEKPTVSSGHPHIRIWGIPPFFEGDKGERLYGASVAIIQYNSKEEPEHTVLIDSGMKKDNGKLYPPLISKLKAAGAKKLTLVLSHAHGDHYGLFTDVFESFEVETLYLPPYDGLKTLGISDKVSAIINQEKKAKKYGAACRYLKPGTGFRLGAIKCDCIFQANPKELTHKDGHEGVNSLSIYTRFTLDNIWRLHNAGDAENDANNLFVKKVKDASADVMFFDWHTDGNATNEALLKAVSPKICISNYHHKERSGRGAVRKKAEAVGAVVARNWENGDVYVDIRGGEMVLSCSKGNIYGRWTKKKDLDGKLITAGAASKYDVCLTTKAKPVKGSGLKVIEPEDYTLAEIKALKAAGYTVLGYLSIGSVSMERSYFKKLEKYTLRRLDDWEKEYYLDVCVKEVQAWAIARGKEIINAGCDGLWIDNADVYEEYPSDAAYKGITSILQTLHSLGYIMINGGIAYMTRAIKEKKKVADAVTQEEVFTRITNYTAPGTFSAQTSKRSAEYQKYMAAVMAAGMDAFLLEYTRDEKMKQKIRSYCAASGAGYCISENVNL